MEKIAPFKDTNKLFIIRVGKTAYFSANLTKTVKNMLKKLPLKYKRAYEMIRPNIPQKLRFELGADVLEQFMNLLRYIQFFKTIFKPEDICIFRCENNNIIMYHVIIRNYYVLNAQIIEEYCEVLMNCNPQCSFNTDIYKDGYAFSTFSIGNNKTGKEPFIFSFKDGSSTHEATFEESLIYNIEGCMLIKPFFIQKKSTMDRFIHECCIVGEEYMVDVKSLYQKYVDWCGQEGIDICSKIAFCRKVNKRGFKSIRQRCSSNKRTFSTGIKLNT